MLETNNLSISFGGHRVVTDFSCKFRPGELTAIVGPNGAGKTTLFNLLSGQLVPVSGTVGLNGKDITKLGPVSRARLGIGRAFQLTNLFPALSVHENVRLVVQSRQNKGVNFFTTATGDHASIEAAFGILDRCNLGERGDDLVSALPHGEQRKLEVAMLLAAKPQVFMFDEPTAGMSQDEVPDIVSLIEKLREDNSRTLLLVEHKIDIVFALADRIIVLNNGLLVADGPPQQVMDSPIVRSAYLGEQALPETA